MAMTAKLSAGSAFPSIPVATVDGTTADPSSQSGWRMLVVYRGKHCPLCKKYLKTLDGLRDGLSAAGVTVLAASADPREKAEADVASEGWRFPVGYGLSMETDASTRPLHLRSSLAAGDRSTVLRARSFCYQP